MTDMRPAPYAADTRARGWRFEVDMETVKASDTWLRAKTGELRGALMLLWGEAWQQTPCGSLPNDDELVALIIDMPSTKFTKNRGVLMRGWWLAEDGRLYHDTIVNRVLSMLEKRASDAERSAKRRARQAAASSESGAVTPVSRVTPPGSTREFATKHQIPDTSSNTPLKPPRKRGSAAAQLVSVDDLTSEGVAAEHARDWLAIRKEKRLPLTPTAWQEVKAQALQAGLTPAVAVHTAVNNSWAGFKAKWLTEDGSIGGAGPGEWWKSRTGLLQKGADLGVTAPPEGNPHAWQPFVAQVWVKAGDGPWWDNQDTAYPHAVRLRDGGARDLGALALGALKREAAPHA